MKSKKAVGSIGYQTVLFFQKQNSSNILKHDRISCSWPRSLKWIIIWYMHQWPSACRSKSQNHSYVTHHIIYQHHCFYASFLSSSETVPDRSCRLSCNLIVAPQYQYSHTCTKSIDDDLIKHTSSVTFRGLPLLVRNGATHFILNYSQALHGVTATALKKMFVAEYTICNTLVLPQWVDHCIAIFPPFISEI